MADLDLTTILAGSMGRDLSRNLTAQNPRDPTAIMQQQNRMLGDSHQENVRLQEAKRLAADQAVTEQANYQKELTNIETTFQSRANDVRDRVRENTSGMQENYQQLREGYTAERQNAQQIVENGNFSFFRNPISYAVTQYRLNNSETKLRAMERISTRLQSEINSEYALAAQEIRTYREGELVDSLLANKAVYIGQQERNAKFQNRINEWEANIQSATTRSEARHMHSLAELRAEKDELRKDQLARYMYRTLNGGSADGYSSDVHRESMFLRFQTSSPEVQAAIGQGFSYMSIAETAGVNWNNNDNIGALLTSSTLGAAKELAKFTNQPAVVAALDEGSRKYREQMVAQAIRDWEANPENKATKELHGGMPDVDRRALDKRVDEAINNLHARDILTEWQGSFRDPNGRMATTVTANADRLLAVSGMDIITALDDERYSQDVIDFFQSSEYADIALAGAKGPGNLPANNAVAMIERMEEKGISRPEAIRATATVHREMAKALFLRDGGRDAAIAMELAPFVDTPNIPVIVQPVPNTGAWRTWIQDERISALQSPFDLSNPEDLTNLYARMKAEEKRQAKSPMTGLSTAGQLGRTLGGL